MMVYSFLMEILVTSHFVVVKWILSVQILIILILIIILMKIILTLIFLSYFWFGKVNLKNPNTDADSFMYQIRIEDVYEDCSGDKEMFDFSNYSTKS